MARRKSKRRGSKVSNFTRKITKAVQKSPINFFSDLFIVAMVSLWIVDNIYEALVATMVTVSSIVLSHSTGCNCYEVSMWSSIGSNIAIPLGAGGAIWMIKNGVQHAIANSRGETCEEDFPNDAEVVDPPDTEEPIEAEDPPEEVS